jgi:predicted ATPase
LFSSNDFEIGSKHKEASAKPFNQDQVQRFSAVMGRAYDSAKMALADIDDRREVPVISKFNTAYSGFHQGSGETTIAELLRTDLPRCALVLIDEIESSLHPRAQRRLVRDLAERCREREIQIILTTHSPFLQSLRNPPERRLVGHLHAMSPQMCDRGVQISDIKANMV